MMVIEIVLESKLFYSDITNTFDENKNTKSTSINKEDISKISKTCCCSLYKMDHNLKNIHKAWSMID
jgi:hypothetical protein